MNNDALGAIREQIDEVDSQLLELVQKRMQMSKNIAEIKRESNMPIYDALREQEIIARLTERADEDCKMAVGMVMRTMFALSRVRQRQLLMPPMQLLPPARKLQKEQPVCAYQNAEITMGEQAAKTLFPQAGCTACQTSGEVFAAVKEGRADYGVVPIENSQTGTVGETYDLLRRNACYVVGRVKLESSAGNTSFVAIAAEPEYDESCNRVSITFVVQHRSGALCETLMPFHSQGTNLERLESHQGPQGGYRFFADIEGNILDSDLTDALQQASETCEYLEVLGCYRS